MEAKDLYCEIFIYKKISIDEQTLYAMRDFKSAKEVPSLESVALTISGHQPIRDYKFDKSKLIQWAKNKNISVVFDEMNRLVHFKLNNP